jgi:hypothetical protein
VKPVGGLATSSVRGLATSSSVSVFMKATIASSSSSLSPRSPSGLRSGGSPFQQLVVDVAVHLGRWPSAHVAGVVEVGDLFQALQRAVVLIRSAAGVG